MKFRNSESVTFLRASPSTSEDSQGNPVPGPDTARVSTGWAVAPVTGSDDPSGLGAQVIVGYQLLKPNVIEDVSAFDRVIVRGHVCAVVGEIGDWVSPFAAGRGGTVVNVKRGV